MSLIKLAAHYWKSAAISNRPDPERGQRGGWGVGGSYKKTEDGHAHRKF